MAPIGRLAVDLQFQPWRGFATFFGGGNAYDGGECCPGEGGTEAVGRHVSAGWDVTITRLSRLGRGCQAHVSRNIALT